MKSTLQQQIPPVASWAAVHFHLDVFALHVLEVGVEGEGENAVVDVF